MLLSIVIPVYNPAHLESKIEQFLVPQLESFRRNTTLAGIELVYVCNGCTEKTREVLTEYKKSMPIKILWFDQGLGFTKATNVGIKASVGEIVLMFNDDAVILDYCPKDMWMRWLLSPFWDDAKIGMTGVHELYCHHSQENFFVGYCVACRRKMLEEIGLLDEIFSPGAGEDTDLCIRARLHGWKTKNVDPKMRSMIHSGEALSGEFTYPIWHPGESTFHNWEHKGDYAVDSKWDRIFKRNSLILSDRRSMGYYSEKQPRINTIPELTPISLGLKELLSA
jgi:GT2 family glycosyltransferase